VEATHAEGSEGDAGGLRLRLLGDIQAEIGGRQVKLGHPRQRAALAVLAVEANRVVPVEQLTERRHLCERLGELGAPALGPNTQRSCGTHTAAIAHRVLIAR
jgi:hypothetical protein